jgi:hypothetical protein
MGKIMPLGNNHKLSLLLYPIRKRHVLSEHRTIRESLIVDKIESLIANVKIENYSRISLRMRVLRREKYIGSGKWRVGDGSVVEFEGEDARLVRHGLALSLPDLTRLSKNKNGLARES